MEKTASKLDWLKERKDFNSNPVARAATRILEHNYAPYGDDLYPWILREVKRGNISLPTPYTIKGGWMRLVETEMAVEKELARRQLLTQQPGVVAPDSWGEDRAIDWDDLENAAWNRLHDAQRVWNEPISQWDNGWQALNKLTPDVHFKIKHPPIFDDIQKPAFHPLQPEHLKDWEKILKDRAKRRKGVDPMQFAAHEFQNKMNDEWGPEYDEQQRGQMGEVVHQWPDKWSVRRIQNAEEAEDEGEQMGHCLGGYGSQIESGHTHAFSLRDPRNRPHATIEIRPGIPNTDNIPEEEFERWGIPEERRSWVNDELRALQKGYQSEEPLSYHHKAIRDMAQDIWNRYQQNTQPWHGGELVQVQGKENSTPNPEYQARIGNWFGSLPEQAQPTGTEGTPYNPQEYDAHYGHTLHYPAPAHRNWATGDVCHCGFGPERELWSWNEHTAGWEDDIPNPSSEPQPWQRGLNGKGLLSDDGLRVWSTDEYGDPHHDDVAAREGIDYLGKVDVRPDGRAGLTQPDATSLRGLGRDEAEELLAQLAPQNGLSFKPGFFAKSRQRSPVGEALTEWTDVDPILGALHRGPASARLTIAQDLQLAEGAGLGGASVEQMPHTRIIPKDQPVVECPTCKGPMTNGFCPQCQWSEHNPNLDSDPLSNPPDPTVDLHKGIQARIIPSHRHKWFEAID